MSSKNVLASTHSQRRGSAEPARLACRASSRESKSVSCTARAAAGVWPSTSWGSNRAGVRAHRLCPARASPRAEVASGTGHAESRSPAGVGSRSARLGPTVRLPRWSGAFDGHRAGVGRRDRRCRLRVAQEPRMRTGRTRPSTSEVPPVPQTPATTRNHPQPPGIPEPQPLLRNEIRRRDVDGSDS